MLTPISLTVDYIWLFEQPLHLSLHWWCFCRQRKFSVVACLCLFRQLDKGYSAFFFSFFWPFDICSSLFLLFRPQNENAMEASGHCNIPMMCDGFAFSLQVHPVWHKQRLLPFQSHTISNVRRRSILKKPHGGAFLLIDSHVKWCTRVWNSIGSHRICSCAAAAELWQRRHEGNSVCVKDVLFGRAVILCS